MHTIACNKWLDKEKNKQLSNILMLMLLHYSSIVDVNVYIKVTTFNFNDDNADLLIIGINYQIWVMS